MKKEYVSIIVITVAVILGLLIGFNDNFFIQEEVNSDDLLVSGDLNSGDFSGDVIENISGDFSEIPDDNFVEVIPPETIDDNILSGETSVDEQPVTPPINVIQTDKYIPENIKAVYATGWVIGTKSIREDVVSTLKENGYNAIVIDIKDEAGQLSYISSVQTAKDIGASVKMISNVKEIVQQLKDEGFYVIGRIVTFKDPIYASKVSSIAYKKEDGSIWKDYSGNCWPNPYNKESWNYPIEIAKEAAEIGFQEIQFDYIRFPSSEGKTSTIVYGFDRATKSKSDMINGFLEKAMKELKPYNVVVSADVFGITTKRDGDFENIGQDFSKIASIVDVICPMVYPSHYANNEYKISRPDKEPYKVVTESMLDAFERYDSYVNTHSGDSKEIKLAKFRPYIQDFTASWLGKGNYIVYGNKEVATQIQALYDLKIYDFCLWDPNNKYCYTAIKDAVIKNNTNN